MILDDLGYVRKDHAETNVLFELIAERYERKSLIVTCYQPFSEWDKIFPDPSDSIHFASTRLGKSRCFIVSTFLNCAYVCQRRRKFAAYTDVDAHR